MRLHLPAFQTVQGVPDDPDDHHREPHHLNNSFFNPLLIEFICNDFTKLGAYMIPKIMKMLAKIRLLA